MLVRALGAEMMNRWKPLIAAALALLAAAAPAQELQVGRDYTEVVPHQPTTDAKRVVVTEFFSYACPHCFSFNPSLTNWANKLPKDVLFERVAVVFGRQPWQKPAQVFYALQSLGKAEELSPAVFGALHVERADWRTDAQIIDWVAAHGVNRRPVRRGVQLVQHALVHRARRSGRDRAQGSQRADARRRRQVRADRR